MGLSLLAKMKLGVCAGLLITASAAQAQFIAEDIETQSAAGALRIEDGADGFSRYLVVGDSVFFADDQYRFVSIEDQRGSLYLISLSSGGNACEAGYVWLHTDGPLRLSPEFGNCAPHSEVRSDAETVSVVMPARVAADGFVAFVYDGSRIEEVIVGQETTEFTQDPANLVGRYPSEVFRDAGWRETLVDLMGEEGYRRAGEVISTSSQFVVQGDWVVGSGFNNRMVGNANGAIALHRADGRILIAIRTGETGLQVWGDPHGAYPELIQAVIDRR